MRIGLRIGLRVGDGEIAGGNVADFKHLLDGGDAGDGFFGELADAVGERAGQLTVDIDRTAAHAFDDAGVFGLVAAEPGEDEVLAGTTSAAQDAENFNLHGFGSGALKDGPGRAGHAGANLAERKEAGIGWRAGGCGGGLR